MTPHRLILASASHARLAVLHASGLRPEVLVSGVDETVDALDTATAVSILAERKASAVASGVTDALVIGCDSMLEVGDARFGKPESNGAATTLWRHLSGRQGVLFTGHWVIDTRSGRSAGAVGRTLVRFCSVTEAEIAAYVATGEPLASAGGFTIEGYGAPFVESIEGSSSNVLGLSMPILRQLLARLGLGITDFWH